MTTWTKKKLGELCVNITDGKHGDCESESKSGYFFISSKDVYDGKIHYGSARQITKNDFLNTHRRTKLEVGDILITNSGSIGRMAYVKSHPYIEKTTFQKSVAIIKPNNTLVNTVYLYYLLLKNTDQLVNLGGGSAQHNLLLGDLRNYLVSLPDLTTQQKIASILSTYDDLIEVNEKRIKILEEMAERLYTEWFVHFRFPGHEKVKLVDSHTSFGMIPEGWEVKKLNEVARAVRGCTYSSREISDQYGTYNLVNLKNVNKGGGFRSGGEKYFSGRAKPEQLLFQGDIVIAVTDMTPDRAIVGRPARIPTLEGKITFSADLVKIVSSHLPNSFLYYLLVDKRFTETTKIKANGANVLHLSPLSMLDYPLVKPTDPVLLRYSEKTTPLLEEMDKLTSTNTHLQTARDLLIPQLISGKREVK